MTPRTWLQNAITAAAPALRRELRRQLTEPVDAYLRTGAAPTDPTTAALVVIDANLQRRSQTPADQRGPGWHQATDFALDYRLRLMADRARGYRVTDRRHTR
jgi:hypothetical protein